MLCPQCKVALEPLTYRKVTIDKCPKCYGVWLDKGEEAFVSEILKNANQAACRDCKNFEKGKKLCNLLKIFTTPEFSCANFVR